MTIKYLPVLPPNLRPSVEINNNQEKIQSQLNELYSQIIKINNRIKAFQNNSLYKEKLKKERSELQKAVEALIDNDTENSKNSL